MSERVEDLIEQAFAHDAAGDGRAAIKLYDAAYRLGVPEHQRKRFLVGYGATLRDVGRAEESVAILAQAVADYPDYPACTAFLALALADAGHPQAALATMLGCVLDVAPAGVLDGHERALGAHHRELLDDSQSRG